MRHTMIEAVMGAFVLSVAGFFLAFALRTAQVDTSAGYEVSASFSNVNGVLVGSDVRLGGVKIGSVSKLSLDPVTYQAVIQMTLDKGIQLPDDSSATIRSESLMGGKYLAIEPGGSDTMLADGGKIEYTQSTPDLEQMLGQAIFSMSGDKDKKETTGEEKEDGQQPVPSPDVLAPVPDSGIGPAPSSDLSKEGTL